MQSPLYKVVFSGDLEEGYTLEVVKHQCAALFKKPPAQIESLFAGKSVTIKSGLSQEQAKNYVRALSHIGARAKIVTIADAVTGKTTSKPKTNSNAKTAAPPATEIDRLLAGFKGRVAPVVVPTAYRVGIVAVSIAMLLLPVLYLLLINLVASATVSYAVSSTSLFHRSGSFYFALITYTTPVVAGSILTLFLLKPLLAFGSRNEAEIVLVPSQQPHFFKFVYRVCDAVGAPRPSIVKINNEVNASAGFYQGMRSFFSRKLVLTVGLPLVAGLDTRQLAGVLAHEFGHFSQGAGMRTTHIIRRVNHWFAVAVYRRDRLDEWLDHNAESEYSAVKIALQVTRLLVLVTRRVLWVLMLLGNVIGAWISRQMEFDADRYEARLAGSENFKRTTLQLARLDLAYAEVTRNINLAWEDHQRLVNDLSAAVVYAMAQQPKNIEEKIEKNMELERSERFDTHPSDIERIENAMLEEAEGIFQVELPAHALMTGLAELSGDATYRYYRRQLQLDVAKSQLIPLDEFTVMSSD